MTMMNIEQKAGMQNTVRDIRRERDALQKTTKDFYKFIGVGAVSSLSAIGVAAFSAIYNLSLGPVGAIVGSMFAVAIASIYYAYDTYTKVQNQENKLNNLEAKRNSISNDTVAFNERQAEYVTAEEVRKALIEQKTQAEAARRAEIDEIAERMKNMRGGSMDWITARIKP